MADQSKCALCGEPMPEGEEMFNFHGYSGDCPKAPLPRMTNEWTQERIAEYQADTTIVGCTSRDAFAGLLTLAARGLTTTEDAEKARALERYVAAKRDELSTHQWHSIEAKVTAAHNAMFALCPAPTKTGESDG